MDSNEWVILVEENFDLLFQKNGFKIISKEYWEKSFGSRLVILENERFFLNLELERGIIFLVRIIPKDHSDFSTYLTTLVGFLEEKAISHFQFAQSDPIKQIIYAGNLFREHDDDVSEFFDEQNWEEKSTKLRDYIQKSL